MTIDKVLSFIRSKVKGIIITDVAETSKGYVVFSIENQPLLVHGEKITGLNWSYVPDLKIIKEAIDAIGG